MSEMSGGCIYNNQAIDGAKYRINSEGLIELAGPMMAEGVGVDGWFTTSDLGEVIADRILIKGRADDVIVSGGENISLHQIEVVLAPAYPDQEIIAIGIPDKEWGERLALVSNNEIDLDRAKNILKESIGRFASPKQIMVLDSLPMKGIGKPDRARARELFIEKNGEE
jgi:O-succinylbenzoic acid--CoA ligase